MKKTEELKRLLELMGFEVVEEGEYIIATGRRDYNASIDNIWVDDIEEILIPSIYGYTATFKRWQIIFSPY